MPWTAEYNREYQREWARRERRERPERSRARNQRYRENHRAELTARQQARYKRYKEADPNFKEKRNAQLRAKRRAGLFKMSPETRRRRADQQRLRRILNREQYLAERRLRRLGYDREANEYAAVLLGDPCSYCGRQTETVDHIDPVSAGGPNEWANLTAACRSCNSSKYDRPLLNFLACMAVEQVQK